MRFTLPPSHGHPHVSAACVRSGDSLMSFSRKRTPAVSRRWTALLLVPALGVLGACGSSATSASGGGGDGAVAAATGGAGGGSGLSASLQLKAIEALTGPAGFAGPYTQQG